MAVTILFGKGNSGKTSYCFDRLITAADAGKKTVLLVPDQGTYNAERRLAAHTRRHGFMGTRVLGFSRLAYLVLQERNREKTALSDFDKRIVLRRLTAKNTEAFSVLRQAAEQPNFAEILSAFIDECRSFDISAAALQESAAALDEGVLKHKLTDIAFLYGKYEAYLEERFGSAHDVFSALAEEDRKSVV